MAIQDIKAVDSVSDQDEELERDAQEARNLLEEFDYFMDQRNSLVDLIDRTFLVEQDMESFEHSQEIRRDLENECLIIEQKLRVTRERRQAEKNVIPAGDHHLMPDRIPPTKLLQEVENAIRHESNNTTIQELEHKLS